MEKFRAYSDEATGVNPFVPTWCSLQRLEVGGKGLAIKVASTVVRAVWLVFASLRALVRAAVLLVAAAASGLLLLLPSLPIRSLQLLRWKVQRLLLFFPLRLALFALGFTHIDEREVGKHDARRNFLLMLRPFNALRTGLVYGL